MMHINLKQLQEIESNINDTKCTRMQVDLSHDLKSSIDLKKFENHVRRQSENINIIRIVDDDLNFKTLELFLHFFENLEVIEFKNERWCNLHLITGTFPTIKEIVIDPYCIRGWQINKDFLSCFLGLWFPNLTKVTMYVFDKYKINYELEYEQFSDVINKSLDLVYVTHISNYCIHEHTDYTFVKRRIANIKIEELTVFAESSNYEMAMETIKSHPEISELRLIGHIENDDFEWICKNLKELKALDITRMNINDDNDGGDDKYRPIAELQDLNHLEVRHGQIKDEFMEFLNKRFPKLGIRYYKYDKKSRRIYFSKIVEKPPYNFHADHNFSPVYSRWYGYSEMNRLIEQTNDIKVYAEEFSTGLNRLEIKLNIETINLRMLVLIKEQVIERNGKIKYIEFSGVNLNFDIIYALLHLLFDEVEEIHFSAFNHVWSNFKDVDGKFSSIKRIEIEDVPEFDDAEDVFKNWKSWFPNVTQVKLNYFNSNYKKDQLKFVSSFVTHIDLCYLRNSGVANDTLVKNCLSNLTIAWLQIETDQIRYDTFMDIIMNLQPHITNLTYNGYIEDDHFEWICNNMCNLKELDISEIENLSPAAYAHIKSLKKLETLKVDEADDQVEVIKEYFLVYIYDEWHGFEINLKVKQQLLRFPNNLCDGKFSSIKKLWSRFKDVDGAFSSINIIEIEEVSEIDEDAEDVFKNWKSWFPNVTEVKLIKFNSNYKKDQLKFVSMFVTHIELCFLRNTGVTNYTLVKNCLSNLTIEKLWIQTDQTKYDTFMEFAMQIMNSQPHITDLDYGGYIEDDHFEWICNNMCNLKDLDISEIENLSPAAYAHIKSLKKLETLKVPKSSAQVEVIKEYLLVYTYKESHRFEINLKVKQQLLRFPNNLCDGKFSSIKKLWSRFKDVDGKFSSIKRIEIENVPEFDDAEDVFKNWKSWFPNLIQVKLNRFNSNYKKDQLKFVSMFVTHIDWCYLRNSGVTNYTLVKNCLSNLTIERLQIGTDQINYDTFMEFAMQIINSQPHITHLKYIGYIEDDHFEWICNNMCNLKDLDISEIENLSPAAYAHIKSLKKLEKLKVPESSAHVEVIKEYLLVYTYKESHGFEINLKVQSMVLRIPNNLCDGMFSSIKKLWSRFKDVDGKFSSIKRIEIEKVPEFDDAEDVFKNWKSWFPNVTQVKLNRFRSNSNYKKDQLKFVSSFVTHIKYCRLRNSGDTNYTLVKNCLSNLTIENLWIQTDQTNYETIIDIIMNLQPHITNLKYIGYIEDDHFEWICNNMCNLKKLDIYAIENLSPAAYVHIKNLKKLESLKVPKSSAQVEVIKEYLTNYESSCYSALIDINFLKLKQNALKI